MSMMKRAPASAAFAALLASSPVFAATNAAPRVAGDYVVNVTIECPADIFQNVTSFLQFYSSDHTISYPAVIDVHLDSAGALVQQLFSAHFSSGQAGTVLFAGTENAGSALTKERNLDFPAQGQAIDTYSLIGNSPYALAGSRYVGTFTWKLPNTAQSVSYTAYFNNIDSTNTAKTIVFQGRPAVILPTASGGAKITNCTAQGTAQAASAAALP